MLYEYGRQTPLASPEEYVRAPQKAREAYINDPVLYARVNHLVAHTLKIIDEFGGSPESE